MGLPYMVANLSDIFEVRLLYSFLYYPSPNKEEKQSTKPYPPVSTHTQPPTTDNQPKQHHH